MKSTRQDIHGILLLDKPLGLSSNSALQRVKRLFNAKKAGHTGSLDPLATGMLPICLGEATKFSQYLLDSNKAYLVTGQLGIETTTGDAEGEIKRKADIINVTQPQLEACIQSFLGEIDQVPPMYSAIKFQGKPLYQLARQGIEIERKPRQVTLFSIELLNFNDNEFSLRVHCSKGTYIRSLIEDIGANLNCGAYVKTLRRIEVSPYHNAIVYTLAELEKLLSECGSEQLLRCLLPMETAIEHLPSISLSAESAFYLRHGNSVRIDSNQPINALVKLMTNENIFLGLGEIMHDGRVKPHRLVAQVS